MEEKLEPLTFRFESGTTQDEMLQYVDIIRARLTGKMPEDVLEHFISDYVASIAGATVMCDGCRKEITDAEKAKLNNKFTFSCRLCPLKFDLCQDCQEDEGTANCPDGFGCQSYVTDEGQIVEEEKTIFIPKPIESREPFKFYEAFGTAFRISESQMINMDKGFLIRELEQCSFCPTSVLYVTQKQTSHELLRDLWIYFRSTDMDCLERYGEPSNPLIDLGSWKVYTFYKQLAECFRYFVGVDKDIDSELPLMMRIIYPNGDEFIILRLHGEMKAKLNLPFLTMFLPVSTYENVSQSDKLSSYTVEPFRKQLEETSGKTMEELAGTGQILLIVLGLGNSQVSQDINNDNNKN